MDLRLSGRKVLITGGSKGIGFAAALAFSAEGCTVHLAARNAAELASARAKITAQHPVEVVCHAVDLSAPGAPARLAAECGSIDILVNNAGAIPGGTLASVTEEQWRQAWDLKVFGYINVSREIYAHMRQAGKGVIVNVIGLAGERPKYDYVAGAAGNAALMAFSRALGGQSANDGIRVLAVNPGLTQTERMTKLMRDSARATLGDESRWEEIYRKMVDVLPFKRAAHPEEVADMVVFLASDRAAYVSGTVVTVDGGYSVRL